MGECFMYKAIELDYSNLSPYLDRKVIEVHYRMYKEALDKLNKLLESVDYDYSMSIYDLIKNIDMFPLSVRGEILYYLSSVVNHTLYFYNISNDGYIEPVGLIGRDIDKYFGSYDSFKREFKVKANELKGSGYTFLVRDDKGKLFIINTSNQDNPYYYGFEPVISLDLWEHAYFLQYEEKRSEYIDSFFKVIDFRKINKCYEKMVNKDK